MQNSWLVIIPPLIALSLSFATHRIILSLFLAIISATFIFHDFSIIPAIKTAGVRLWNTTEISNLSSWESFLQSENLFIYAFILILGIMITLISTTGATNAYANFIQKKLKNRKAAETSSLLLSLMFFIDDYLNVLMVGSVMPPVTDRFKVPRVKLAFFANAFAAALCIIVPFSTWGAYILRQLEHSGVSPDLGSGSLVLTSPLNLFVNAIPFAFYSFIIIAAAFFLVRRNISFGLMHKYESIAQETGDLYGGKPMEKKGLDEHAGNQSNSTIIDFLFPIILLVVAVFVGLYLTNFVAAPSLFIGGITTLTISLPYFLIRKKVAINQLSSIAKEGVMLMLSSLVVITLAWTFGTILTEDLLTGQFLASKLTGSINIMFFPLLFFVISTITTLAIGSSWGSLGVVIPIAIPMVVASYSGASPYLLGAVPIVIPTLSAVLAGAVTGNVSSPIADIVVMASTSTRSHHMDHVKSQQMYVAPVFFASCVSFLMSGLLISYPTYVNALVSLGVGIVTAFIIMTVLNSSIPNSPAPKTPPQPDQTRR